MLLAHHGKGAVKITSATYSSRASSTAETSNRAVDSANGVIGYIN